MNWFKKAQLETQYIFENDVIDFHHGQTDAILKIFDTANTRKALGTISYSIFNDEIFVNLINVQEKYRGMGIATRMLKYLQSEFPETELNMGTMTEQGLGLYKSIPFEYVENKEYTEKTNRLKNIDSKIKSLEDAFDNLYRKDRFSDLDRERADEMNAAMNHLHDEKFEIEEYLRSNSPGKKIIKI